jgi:thiamine biosynthesis lipoprotein
MGDAPPGTKGWKVELVQYDSPDAAAPIHVFLSNAAVATSGDLFQRVEIDGVRYSHILDPFTCIGMTNHALATVIAPTGMIADSLATTMTILEPSEAFRVANRHGAAVRIIRDEKGTPRTYANERFKSLVRKAIVPKN